MNLKSSKAESNKYSRHLSSRQNASPQIGLQNILKLPDDAPALAPVSRPMSAENGRNLSSENKVLPPIPENDVATARLTESNGK